MSRALSLLAPLEDETPSVLDLVWDDPYTDHQEYRARMLAESRKRKAEGVTKIEEGEKVWKTYSNQKMSDVKEEIQR